MIREIIEEEAPFIEIYVQCPLEECIRRDPKGLYKKALRGEIKHFTGISDPYEPPENPDMIVNTVLHGVQENIEKIMSYISTRFNIDP